MFEETEYRETLSPVSTQSERSFAYNVNNFIEEELMLIENVSGNNENTCKEKFQVFKQAFTKIINFVQVYKNLLSNIKKEYELCINELERAHVEIDTSENEVSKLDANKLTLHNLNKRKLDLNDRLNELKIENQRLNFNLEKIISENEKYRPKPKERYSFLANKQEEKVENESGCGTIPGISIEKATDLKYLMNLLGGLETKLSELTSAQHRKYSNKNLKYELEKTLLEKIEARDNLKAESLNIKNKILLYKFAINSAKEYYKGNSRYSSIQDALSRGIVENYLNRNSKLEDDHDESEDTNLIDNESDLIMDFIEKFNDLFEDGEYVKAAYFAAASPKNVLRNIETLFKFKQISFDKPFTADTDPLLIYCISILDSINETTSKPTAEMSLECIRIALKYNKLDLLSRWVAQKKLSFSYDCGKLIEEHAQLKSKTSKTPFELALFIYKEIKASLEIAICLAKLGRLSAMFDYLKSQPSLANNQEIYFKLLKSCPSIELANIIMDFSTKENLKIPIDKIVSVLLDSDQPENGLKFLKVQIQKYSEYNENDENLTKLKTSYETLVKFSFLAHDDDEFTKETALETRDQLQNLYASKSNFIDSMRPKDLMTEKIKLSNLALKNKKQESITEDSESETTDSRAHKSTLKSNITLDYVLVEEDEDEYENIDEMDESMSNMNYTSLNY